MVREDGTDMYKRPEREIVGRRVDRRDFTA